MNRGFSNFVGHTLENTREELGARNAGDERDLERWHGNFRVVFNTNDGDPGYHEDRERRMADLQEFPYHTEEQKDNIRSILPSEP
jgi:hypothetical protein